MIQQNKIQLAFFGDDFTGSTDATEFLTRAGLRTILFLDHPTTEQISAFGQVDALGIAGMTRAMAPSEMEETLLFYFQALKDLNPRHVHYKVCSTFDSSPEIGNIGTAIAAGNRVFNNAFTPILVAAPHLGRYSAFGNLFARMGIGSEGNIHRLDRHPSMSKHPVTPANESDLLKHLGQQTDLKMGLIDLVDLELPLENIEQKINKNVEAGNRILFFDGMYEYQMARIGELIDNQAEQVQTLFSVGSSGVEKALGDYWSSRGLFQTKNSWHQLEESSPILVVSGSVSPVTADQIRTAVDFGFDEIALDPNCLIEDQSNSYIESYSKNIVASFKKGKSVILHTSKGPDDPRVQLINDLFESNGWAKKETSQRLGEILGQAALKALELHPVKRMVIAGGDTSGFVARKLGINAVEMIAPVFPGAPICKAYATNLPVNGMEVNLKGGQVGNKDYFVRMMNDE